MGALARLAFKAHNSGGRSRSTALVVDLYCHASKLVVEIDGKQHAWFSHYNAGRTEILERIGVRVVRFTNEEVCDDLDFVLARIRAELRVPFD